MRGEEYLRPLLCRLCECPVVDGGVQVAQERQDRLSKWWPAHWDTPFEEETTTVCHFCVWDLRFADENSEEKEPEDQTWWPEVGFRNYFKYYSDEWIKSCSVKISLLEEKICEEYRQRVLRDIPEIDHHVATIQHPEDEQQSLKCEYCGRQSTSKEAFHAHLLKDHNNLIFRCPKSFCKVIFKSIQERDKHFEDFHDSGKYFCCFCDLYFDQQKKHYYHMKDNHKAEALKCFAFKECSSYFKTEEDRQKHYKEMHPKIYNCFYCDKPFICSTYVSTHIKMFHRDVAIKCEHNLRCSTWFKSEEERQKHYEEKHESGANMARCPLCAKMFSRDGKIHLHFKTKHPNQKFVKCDFPSCAEYFTNKEDKFRHGQDFHDEKLRCLYCDKFVPKSMRCHIFDKHKDVAIKCNFHDKCPNYFKTVEDRDKHVREVHLVEKFRKIFQCVYCDKILQRKNSLHTHVKSFHLEICIKCPNLMCGTYFKSQDELETHLSIKPAHRKIVSKISIKRKADLRTNLNKEMCPHCKKPTSKIKDHIISDFCKGCNKKFLCIGLLKSHRKKCRSVFHCPVCSEPFKIQSELNYHCKKKHTVPIRKWRGFQFESRGFKCDDCLTYFRSKCGLQRHTRRLHGSTIFTCDFCQRHFSNKLYLKNHMGRYHLDLTNFFHCPVCNLKMEKNNKIWQRAHAATHFNQNLVTCELCAKIMKPSALKSHLRRLH